MQVEILPICDLHGFSRDKLDPIDKEHHMSKIRLSEEVIRAREAAQKAREEKPLDEVVREICEERREREILPYKRTISAR